MSPRRRQPAPSLGRVTAACLLVSSLALGACRAKPKDFDNENDELRRAVAQLETERDALLAEVTELRAKLQEIARNREIAGEPAGDVLEAIPRVAGLTIGRLTAFDDRDAEPGPDVLDVYIRPFDGRQRFVQLAGTLTVQATAVPEPGEDTAEPRVVASQTLRPPDLREAYRSSPLGTHYTVSMPLRRPNADPGPVTVTVTYVDALTGLSHSASKVVR